jgi:predicted nucleic acid-binding protein
MLVLDASVAFAACVAAGGFEEFGAEPLVAPPLMWSEARSAIHELAWRGQIAREDAEATRRRLERCPVKPRAPRRLGEEAWRVAEEFGWAKTYDAEYVALARVLHCRLVTLDARLRRGTERLGFVVSPTEL